MRISDSSSDVCSSDLLARFEIEAREARTPILAGAFVGMTVVPEEPLSEAVRVVRPGVDDAVAAADNGGRLIGGSRRSEDGEKGQEQAHARWLCQHGPAGK